MQAELVAAAELLVDELVQRVDVLAAVVDDVKGLGLVER